MARATEGAGKSTPKLRELDYIVRYGADVAITPTRLPSDIQEEIAAAQRFWTPIAKQLVEEAVA